jgi:Rrf2 family protein
MLTKKTKYAIKALMILAKSRSDLPLRAADIAARERIPAKYLESILVELRNAGFLHSKKGMSGGYILGKPADAILLVQILRLTDGPIALVPCASLNYYHKCEECHDEPSCGIRAVYIGIRDATLKILSETSIADLINKEKNLELILKKVLTD